MKVCTKFIYISSIVIMIVGIVAILFLCYYTGLLLFAAYHKCDPVTTQVNENLYEKLLEPSQILIDFFQYFLTYLANS